MLPFFINAMRLLIRLIALIAFIAGLIVGREMLHETFDARRQPQEQRFERSALPPR